MEIEYFGANTVRLSTKSTKIVIDDTVGAQGKKSITKDEDVRIQTDPDVPVADGGRLRLKAPGEFEVGDISIKGTAFRGHRDEEGKKSATVFSFDDGEGNVVVLGHIHPDVTENQLEALGEVNVLIVPVGGHGFTLDAEGALKVIKKLSPNVVIPTYYNVDGITTDMPQATLDEALNALAIPADEPQASLKIKRTDFDNDQTKVVVLAPKG